MPVISHSAFLKTALRIDAVTCVAMGLLMTVGSGLISDFTRIPETLLMAAGLSLFPIAAFIGFVSSRELIRAPEVWIVIFGNIGWVMASLWLLAAGTIMPNSLGVAFVALQAAAVALLAAVEYAGLNRRRAAS
jgi:hypothetical protein